MDPAEFRTVNVMQHFKQRGDFKRITTVDQTTQQCKLN